MTGPGDGPSYFLDDYDFQYPEALVASEPLVDRDGSRLLVLERAGRGLSHALFRDVGRWLRAGDCLVVNRTRVLPARLIGRKPSGGRAELLLLREVSPGRWSALASRLRPGARVLLGGGAEAVVESVAPDGEHVLRFSTADVRGLMARFGAAPLPPYVLKRRAPADKARAADLERYQTVYAREDGSIAAPTAGLHFTPGLLSRLEALGVRVAGVTLHVGRGTFQGVACPDVREHRMLAERFSVSQEDARLIASARRAGGRVVAVGTSAVRVLETLARSPGVLQGETDLFVRPGHEFRGTDALVTNFHQPRSTPLLLACAFAGRGRLLGAYREAFELGYRLFSYGDAMLVL